MAFGKLTVNEVDLALAVWEYVPKLQGMFDREIATLIRQRLAMYPAVVLVGPRQCGKTTLARQQDGYYFDLEVAGDRARLDAEWAQVVGGDRLVILDEAQEDPAVFSRLRSAIDADRDRRGRFLLLGSVSPALMAGVAESLAGRLGMVHMAPLVLAEVGPDRFDDLWLYGGFPDGGIRESGMFPVWQQDYLEALATRDLPQWGLTAPPRLIQRLIAMLAAEHAQTFNASKLGAALGIDHKTVQHYCDRLEGAFLIRRLQPWAANIRKRLVRRPKVFWRDSGLLHGVLEVENREQLYRRPWLGASWEGFVIEQTLASMGHTGLRAKPYFFRTSDGYELDLVLDWGDRLWAMECKLTSDPGRDMVERLHTTADLIGAERRFLVCRIAQGFNNERTQVCDLATWLQMLRSQGDGRG